MTSMINPMIGMPQGAEWLVILFIVVLVFGAAKLPDLARSSGQALKIFKDETKNLRDDKDPKDAKAAPEELQTREETQAEAHNETSGEVLRERRDDTTA
ncbi:sec-independent protein translocase protein TatA [Nocardioides sp. BE266]|nr:sec-independent protein translocase protein TatA [Nocardioides sp. BE266]